MLASSAARGQEWVGAGLIDAGAGKEAYDAQIALDADGNGIAVMEQRSGSSERIFANRWDGTSWQGAGIIDAGTGHYAYAPRVAVSADGKGMAAFVQFDGVRERVCANRWDGNSWTAAVPIDAGTGFNAGVPGIAVDGNGNSVAVFRQSDGEHNRICANRWDGSEWTGATCIDAGPGNDAEFPQVAMDGSGNAFAVFLQWDGSSWRVYANRWNGASWTGADLIDMGETNLLNGPHIAADQNGNAVAVFLQRDGAHYRAYANRWNGTWWTGPTLISVDAERESSQMRVAMVGGNAIAVFAQGDGEHQRMYANRWNGTGWTGAQVIDAGTEEDAYGAQVAMDGDGNAIAVIVQGDGTHKRAYANRWDGASWTGAVTIDSGAAADAKSPDIALNGAGQGIAVFLQPDAASTRVYANRFVVPEPVVPQAEIVLNGSSFEVGEPFKAEFRLNEAVARVFNAYAVVNLPDGSMRDAITLSQSIKPVATNVNGLPAGFAYPLMSLAVPTGAPRGNCSVMVGFFDPNAAIHGPQDAFLLATALFVLE